MYKMFVSPKIIIIGAESADFAPKSVYLYSIISLEMWNDCNINTRNNSRSDNPGDICPQGIPQNKRVRIILTNQLLSYLCRSRHTTDSCDYMMYPPIIPPIPESNSATIPNTSNFRIFGSSSKCASQSTPSNTPNINVEP